MAVEFQTRVITSSLSFAVLFHDFLFIVFDITGFIGLDVDSLEFFFNWFDFPPGFQTF